MGFLKEFKDFAMRGNVVDMAVGVVIGAAFGKIVSSLVADIIMPPIGLLIGGVNFTDLKLTLKDGAEGVDPVTLNYGNFLQVCIDFLIIAFAIFLVVKLINTLSNLRKKEEEVAAAAPAPAPEPSAEEKLLAEIRDILKKDKE